MDSLDSPCEKKFIEIKAASIFKFKEVGDSIEGYYQGHETIKHTNPFTAFKLKKEDGTIWSFAQSGRLGELIGLPVGTYVRITFKGKSTTKKGFPMNEFKIEYME